LLFYDGGTIMLTMCENITMQIIIQSPGFKVSDSLEEFIGEKAGKLGHNSQKISRADVTLFKGAESELQNYYCEIRLEIPGNDLYAQKNSSSFEHAIAETVEALKSMVGKSKDKELESRNAH
jgi:putative sigma-54 modulation protein